MYSALRQPCHISSLVGATRLKVVTLDMFMGEFCQVLGGSEAVTKIPVPCWGSREEGTKTSP